MPKYQILLDSIEACVTIEIDPKTHMHGGAWVVENKGDHPACLIFGVSDTGEELMLDVSFDGVKVEGTPILELAWEEPEHRTSWFAKVIGR